MNPLKAFAERFTKKQYNPDHELGHSLRAFGGGYIPREIGVYRNDYENSYSSIRVIANGFMRVEPFTVDKNGNSVPSNLLDRLYTPNTMMSAVDFREALVIMSLIHDKVYVRPHHTGTRLNINSLTGFTFLEDVSEQIVGGNVQYRLPSAEVLTDKQVMVLRSINPYRLHDGFSAAHAARRWTRLDDLIADFQTGFFENGAVPAGQFIITAKTTADFRDIKDGILRHHRGAGNNNNIMFVHRPTDATGKPVEAQVEWVPFASENRNLALKDLFEQANKKIDSVYGVPSSLRGVNDTNTYASVRVDQQIFNEQTLRPLTLKIWSKFTHELNRITGGLGVAIAFDIETPVVADEEKVKAEAKQTDAQTVINLTTQGYELDSAIEYVKTGDISALKQLPKPVEEPEVLDSEEAKGTPEQPADPANPVSKAFSPADREKYELRAAAVVRDALERQTDAAAELLASKAISEDSPVDEAEDERLYEELSAVLLAALAYQGNIEHRANIELVLRAGIGVENVSPFIMSRSQRDAYEALLQKVARDVNATTATKIRNVLAIAREQNLPAAQIREQLKGLVEDWRIKQISVTEVNRAGNEASLYSMENIARETGATVTKTWTHSGGDAPCEYCAALIGRTTGLTDAFVELDGSVNGVDGGTYQNTFTELHTGGLHPNCHCRQVYEVVR